MVLGLTLSSSHGVCCHTWKKEIMQNGQLQTLIGEEVALKTAHTLFSHAQFYLNTNILLPFCCQQISSEKSYQRKRSQTAKEGWWKRTTVDVGEFVRLWGSSKFGGFLAVRCWGKSRR